jgi:transposase
MRSEPSRKVASMGRGGDPASNESDRGVPGGSGPISARYNASVKELAVAEVDRRRLQNPRDRSIYREVAREVGVGEQSLRLWVKKKDAAQFHENVSGAAAVERGHGEPMSPEQMKSELQLLRRQIQKLRTENDVLKRAFVVFSSEWGSEK